MSESTYSVGKRVYNGSSHAPNLGTSDPMGYIDRELNKPSQTRSGLAEAALRRLRGNGAEGAAPGGPPGMGGSAPVAGPMDSLPTPDAMMDNLMGVPVSNPPIMTLSPTGQIVLKQPPPPMPDPMAMGGMPGMGMPPGMPPMPPNMPPEMM